MKSNHEERKDKDRIHDFKDSSCTSCPSWGFTDFIKCKKITIKGQTDNERHYDS